MALRPGSTRRVATLRRGGSRAALAEAERVLGAEHADTFMSLNNLAALYQDQSRYGEAEQLYSRALEARERVLGAAHPDTLSSFNNLASLYRDLGRYAEAEQLDRRGLEASEQALGMEHPDTLRIVNNLGSGYVARAALQKPSHSTTGR